jgi:hypothetical protein
MWHRNISHLVGIPQLTDSEHRDLFISMSDLITLRVPSHGTWRFGQWRKSVCNTLKWNNLYIKTSKYREPPDDWHVSSFFAKVAV